MEDKLEKYWDPDFLFGENFLIDRMLVLRNHDGKESDAVIQCSPSEGFEVYEDSTEQELATSGKNLSRAVNEIPKKSTS